MLAAGVALKAMQAILGHSPARMTTHTYQRAAARVARHVGLSLLGPHHHTPGNEEEGTKGGRTGPARAPYWAPSGRLGARSVSGLDQKTLQEKQKPQVTASENPGASTEPPSGFEPETYALRAV
ncbi:hypothetical protein GCM10010317_051580 [Streptomyces mirabilis]|nr:hypothetical protein GCM10010317_051580 [Streptomyces mirabilis]